MSLSSLHRKVRVVPRPPTPSDHVVILYYA
jgi:hypothetical protein